MPERVKTECVNWEMFCGESYRHDLTKPFVLGGRKWATDGTIVISEESDEPDTDHRKLPKPRHLINLDAECHHDLPDIDTSCEKCGEAGKFTTKDCVECNASGECQNCGGSGTDECCECGQDVDCEECNGSGVCVECDGNPVEEREVRCACSFKIIGGITLGSSTIALRTDNARRLKSLPGVKLSDPNKFAIHFRAGGIDGTVMDATNGQCDTVSHA